VGPLAYPFAAVRAYLDHKPFEARFAFPDHDHEAVAIDDLIHVAVGNGRYYGGGMIVAPGSGIEDHALDVYAIEATAAPDLTRIAWGLRTGDLVDDKRVHHWRTKRVRIFTDPQLPINLDGELICRTPRTFSVVPDALKVLVPRTSYRQHGPPSHMAAVLGRVVNAKADPDNIQHADQTSPDKPGQAEEEARGPDRDNIQAKTPTSPGATLFSQGRAARCSRGLRLVACPPPVGKELAPE
jgi:hypothetical protein